MNKEIGGYFGLGDLVNFPYYNDNECIKLNCARNCLQYLINAKKIKKIFLPRYICDSVYNAISETGCIYEFYEIDENLKPLLPSKKKNEYFYIVNYFGQMSNEEIATYKYKYDTIIIDNVQSFFQRPVKNVDTIYTCRKYFGVPDGAYLFTTANSNLLNLKRETSLSRFIHLVGRTEQNASLYYKYYKLNEEFFDCNEVKLMSKTSEILMGAMDYKNIVKKRNSNFEFLHAALSAYNELHIKFNEGPYAYPLKIDKGVKLRKKLIENNIFVALLWPNVLADETIKSLAEDIIPLPCDQRYDIKDMKKIVQLIKEELK